MTLARKRIVIGIVLTIAAFGVGAALWWRPLSTVTITQSELQDAINRKLPFDGSRFLLHYRIDAATVDLRPDARIGLTTDIVASKLGHEATIHASGSGFPMYRDGAFYIDGFSLTTTNIVATYESDKQTLAKVENWITSDAEFERRTKEAGSTMLQRIFEQHPVYVLKNDSVKHSLAKLTLKSVEVRDGTLVVTLDPLTALMRILGWTFIVICGVALTICLMMAPGGWIVALLPF